MRPVALTVSPTIPHTSQSKRHHMGAKMGLQRETAPGTPSGGGLKRGLQAPPPKSKIFRSPVSCHACRMCLCLCPQHPCWPLFQCASRCLYLRLRLHTFLHLSSLFRDQGQCVWLTSSPERASSSGPQMAGGPPTFHDIVWASMRGPPATSFR